MTKSATLAADNSATKNQYRIEKKVSFILKETFFIGYTKGIGGINYDN